MRTQSKISAVGAVLLMLAAACGDDAAAPATTPTVPKGSLSGELVVFAAASMGDAITEMGQAFMTEHPEVTVVTSFAGTPELIAQINQGAPVDVLVSADTTSMDELVSAGTMTAPTVFATNSMEIVVAANNPLGIGGLADLENGTLVVLTCAADVPCGRYTSEIFEKANLDVAAASFEPNVKGVINKVAAGEADAGIVYRTDVSAMGDAVAGVEIDPAVNIVAEYPIAVATGAPNSAVAAAFVAFVTGESGRSVLAWYGFALP